MKAKFRIGQRVHVKHEICGVQDRYVGIKGIIAYVSKGEDSTQYGIHPTSGVKECEKNNYLQDITYHNNREHNDIICGGYDTILNHFIDEECLEKLPHKIDKNGNLI